MFWDVFKREGGEAIRPLTASELRDQFEITVAQWIDAHEGHDSEKEADGMIVDIGEELEERLKEVLGASA